LVRVSCSDTILEKIQDSHKQNDPHHYLIILIIKTYTFLINKFKLNSRFLKFYVVWSKQLQMKMHYLVKETRHFIQRKDYANYE